MLDAIVKVVGLSFAIDCVLALRELRRHQAHCAKIRDRRFLREAWDQLVVALDDSVPVQDWLELNPDKTVEEAIAAFGGGGVLARSWVYTERFDISWPLDCEIVERAYEDDAWRYENWEGPKWY